MITFKFEYVLNDTVQTVVYSQEKLSFELIYDDFSQFKLLDLNDIGDANEQLKTLRDTLILAGISNVKVSFINNDETEYQIAEFNKISYISLKTRFNQDLRESLDIIEDADSIFVHEFVIQGE